jgi:DNA-binding beta-propeller fold protein YncE
MSELESISLPGAPEGGVLMDYLAYDVSHHRVWVPAGNTGSVFVVQAPRGQISEVKGFPTSEVERKGKKRTVGPSSAAVGEGTVYVGNRGDSSVCAVNAESLRKGACVKLDSMPDGLQYVRSVKELWVTTPRNNSLTVLDASGQELKVKAKIALSGAPEGFAVDEGRGLFYTNLEDKDRTLVIDIKGRKVSRDWAAGCGADGPKGLSVDPMLNYLLVACSGSVKVRALGENGKELDSMDAGEGVDNIDYLQTRHELYVAAARAGRLSIARLEENGKLSAPSVVKTVEGARNPVVTEAGVAYLTDSKGGKILAAHPKSPDRHPSKGASP